MAEKIIDGKTWHLFFETYINDSGYLQVIHRPTGESFYHVIASGARDMDMFFSELYDLMTGKTDENQKV